MQSDYGSPPKGGWTNLMIELLATDLPASLAFWCGLLKFEIAYQRPEQKFVYLQRPEGIQIMLCQRSGNWETGPMERPFGRGVMFQLYVEELAPLERNLLAVDWPLHTPRREVWRRTGDIECGNREIFVQDPDGYLIMIAERLGQRAVDA